MTAPSRRVRNLAIAATAAMLLATLVWSLVPSPGKPPSAPHAPVPTPGARGAPRPPGLRPYAVALAGHTGLPLDAAPGTQIDVWVVWRPPMTRRTRIEPVPVAAVLERMTAPVTAAGAPTAVLSLPRRDVPTMIHADLYGDVALTLAVSSEGD